MARHRLTDEEKARGYKKLLESKSKRAAGLKAYARKWLREHGHSVAIILVALIVLVAPAHAQRANVKYADQFYFNGQNPTVGQMVTAAQNSCNPDAAVPCQIYLDSILAVYPTGSLPTPCAQCIWIDYRTIGQVKIATATVTTPTQVWPAIGVTFPLLGPNDGSCNPAKSFGTVADGSGFSFQVGFLQICVGNARRFVISTTTLQGGTGALFCFTNLADGSGSCDTGISRGAAGETDFGNGTAADKTGVIKAASEVLTGNITVGSCTGCGGTSAVATGTSTLSTNALVTLTCDTVVTTAATNTLTTDAIEWSYSTAPVAAQDGRLIVHAYVTANNVNFLRCNPTAGSVTGTALVINWRVIR